MPVIGANKFTLWKHVECFFLLVPLAEGKPKAYTAKERDYSHTAVVPHEQGIVAEGDEGLANRGRESAREVVEACSKLSNCGIRKLVGPNEPKIRLRMLAGALVKAYSKPVIEAKISARPTRIYWPWVSD
jgi:hypothetical protein